MVRVFDRSIVQKCKTFLNVLFILQIKKQDVDFYQYYYSDDSLKELKQKMDWKQYPPRCKAKVTANCNDFFIKSTRTINFQILCGTKCAIKGKIVIPSSNNGMQ